MQAHGELGKSPWTDSLVVPDFCQARSRAAISMDSFHHKAHKGTFYLSLPPGCWYFSQCVSEGQTQSTDDLGTLQLSPCFQASFFLLLLCLSLSCCSCALSIRFIRHWQQVLQEQNKECLPTSAEFIAGLSFPIELTAAPRLQGLECSKCFPFVLIISTLNFSQGNRIILHSVTINFISP